MSHSPQDVHKKLLGRKGETLVVKYLKKQGYRIEHRNYCTPFGEADIIAWDREELAFIEVKTRSSEAYGLPSEAVDREKQRRYKKIAECYWLQTGEEPNARFDVAEVYADGKINYIKHAFY